MESLSMVEASVSLSVSPVVVVVVVEVFAEPVGWW
jgi:hypothetical protein